MADTINLTAEAMRPQLIVAVDVSEPTNFDDYTDAEWEIQGYKTEDTAIEYNSDTSTLTDVTGRTFTDVNKFEKAIDFDPNTLRPVNNDGKLNEILLRYDLNDQLSKFSQFRVLVGYGFMGTDGAFTAYVHQASTVTPQSLGGSSRVDMPINIALGGTKVLGTIDKLKKGLVFTPTPAA